MSLAKKLYLSLLSLSLAAACSQEEPLADGALVLDGRASADRASAPDLSPPLSCEKACTTEASYLCVTEAKTGKCVECQKDGHCAANPASLGSLCKNRLCVCSKDVHCKGKSPGGKCQGGGPASCGCTADTDCVAPLRCIGELFSAQICAPPCQSGADCKTKKGLPHCSKVTGKCAACTADSHCAKAKGKFCHAVKNSCVACKRDAHCTSLSAQVCDHEAGRCVACRSDAHCAGALDGSRCSAGKCACKDTKSCGGAAAWGGKCSSKSRRCYCGASADCAGKATGPVCDTKQWRCTCKDDKDCKTAPYSKCAVPYKGAKYKSCQRVCTKDAHCPSKLLPACKTTTGKCLGCLQDSHCAGRAWARLCDAAKGRCIECKKDTDCTAKSLGNTCSSGRCSCKTSSDCSAAEAGKKCQTGLPVCGCAVDADCPAKKKCTGSSTFGTKLCK